MKIDEEAGMDHGPELSRRRFLGATAGTAAAAAGLAGASAAPALAAGKGERLIPRRRRGVMLYTVRDLMTADTPDTLGMVADAGFREVELAGLYDRTPEEFKALLDENKLRPVGFHQWLPQAFGGSDAEAILDTAEALGLKYSGSSIMTLPGLEAQTADLYKGIAEQINEFGRLSAERGIRFYYHNHNWEFATDPATGEVFYEILLRETDPKLVFFELLPVLDHVRRLRPARLRQGSAEAVPAVPRQGRRPEPVAGPRSGVRRSRQGRGELQARLQGAEGQGRAPLPARARHPAQP